MRRVAGSRRPAAEGIADGAGVLIALVPTENGYETRFEDRIGLGEEEVAELLHKTADHIAHKDDRTRGLW